MSWRKDWIATMAEVNDFSLHSILLVAEGQGTESGIVQLLHAYPHLDVGEPEGRGVRGAIGVFTWA